VSQTTATLQRKIKSAGDLQSVVRTMKALAASNIGQYEQAVRALGDYHRGVEMGLSICLRQSALAAPFTAATRRTAVGAVVFGSDQGLVGRFNDVIVNFTARAFDGVAEKPRVWVVGERAYARLRDAGLPPEGLFPVANSVKAIAPLVGRILAESEALLNPGAVIEFHLFHNRPVSGTNYLPVSERLLPLDESWRRRLTERSWPTGNLPEILGDATAALRALVREYLFVSLYRACAESLASENASRLAAMQRADKNIDELLEEFNGAFHSLRQSGIDEELFDVVAGFEALNSGGPW
jgi:F-type H+-transporting ATPase subunit gamma